MTNHGTTDGTTDDTTYDIVLFGATGFVGALTAEYLAGHAPQDLRIALAGRNRAKLEDTRRNLASSHPRAERFGLVIADSSDAESLRALAGSARVVISTVGPYFRYGLPLVEACAKAGTHYVITTPPRTPVPASSTRAASILSRLTWGCCCCTSSHSRLGNRWIRPP